MCVHFPFFIKMLYVNTRRSRYICAERDEKTCILQGNYWTTWKSCRLCFKWINIFALDTRWQRIPAHDNIASVSVYILPGNWLDFTSTLSLVAFLFAWNSFHKLLSFLLSVCLHTKLRKMKTRDWVNDLSATSLHLLLHYPILMQWKKSLCQSFLVHSSVCQRVVCADGFVEEKCTKLNHLCRTHFYIFLSIARLREMPVATAYSRGRKIEM